jgi:ABC-type lipoprotein export system ATPase subunit
MSSLSVQLAPPQPPAAGREVAAVRARGLVKRYENGRVVALDRLDLDIAAGDSVAICGPSGCGKSTLLNMISAIDRPDAGDLDVFGRSLVALTAADADALRTHVIGLVFQLHNLLPGLTAHENVQTALIAAGMPPRERMERATELLARVGLTTRAHALPPTLSGGERQRVAIARALANGPRMILADEPTGALDSRTGDQILQLLAELRRDTGTTLVVVTHDASVAARAARVINMLDGRVTREERRLSDVPARRSGLALVPSGLTLSTTGTAVSSSRFG